MAVFTPGNHSLVRLTANHRICCALQWAGDNNTLFGGYASYNPFVGPGLWRVNGTSGVVTDLIASLTKGDSLLNFASNPFLASDGQLYFFYATLPYTQQEDVSRVPLQLVRSAADGVTDRTGYAPKHTRISTKRCGRLMRVLWSRSSRQPRMSIKAAQLNWCIPMGQKVRFRFYLLP